MDLVYIVKKSEKNEDLRYSLRSVAKNVSFNNIWIVGYKPSWVTNVRYLPVTQSGTKWDNSVKNIIAACECPLISDNFVLMNDDFFAIKPIDDIKKSVNVCLGSLEKAILKYEKSVSSWKKAFKYVYDLLKELNIPGPYYNYESHTPLIINKKKYLEVMSLPAVVKFRKTPKVLHKRSLYKNIDKIIPAVLPSDVKIHSKIDNTLKKIEICDWLSVYDNQVDNWTFRDLNSLLHQMFPDPCQYEVVKEQTEKPKKDIFKF